MPVRAVQSMAAAAMIVVAVAVLAAATLLPALLHLLGPNVDRWRIPVFGTGNPSGGGFWHRTTGAVMRRPISSFLAATAVLLVMASPVIDLRTANTSLSQLPRGEAVVQGSDVLQRDVTGPGQGSVGAVGVLATPLPGQSTASIRPQVGRSRCASRAIRTSSARGSRCSRWAARSRSSLRCASTRRDDAAVNKLVRASGAHRAIAAAAVATAAVGGDSAFQRDLNEEVATTCRYVIGALLVLAYLVLALMLRSLVLPLKAVLTNLLSISAAYGVLGRGLQWGGPTGPASTTGDDRHADAAARARDHVRALDGLRGVPALADPRALRLSTATRAARWRRASRRRRG